MGAAGQAGEPVLRRLHQLVSMLPLLGFRSLHQGQAATLPKQQLCARLLAQSARLKGCQLIA